MARNFTKVYITPKGEKHIKSGHPWVFGEEITEVNGDYQNGDIVDVYVMSVDVAKKRISLSIKPLD